MGPRTSSSSLGVVAKCQVRVWTPTLLLGGLRGQGEGEMGKGASGGGSKMDYTPSLPEALGVTFLR